MKSTFHLNQIGSLQSPKNFTKPIMGHVIEWFHL